jgi:hypothetical protein
MKRRLLICVLIIVAFVAWGEWNNIDRLKVAVLDLRARVDGIDTTTLSELLLVGLVEQNAFQVVERDMIDAVVEEQQFQLSEISTGDIAKLGSLAGAHKIIAGSISRLGDTYFIIVKGIDTTTAVIDLSDQVSSPSVDGLVAVLPVLAERLVRKARGEQVPPFQRAEQSLTILPVTGEYLVEGRNPDGSGYEGRAVLTEDAGTFTMVWYIGDSVIAGSGVRVGDRLTIDWGDTDPAIYSIMADGTLQGVWAGGKGSETLIRR